MFQTSEMISSPSAAAVLGPAKDHPDPHGCLGTLFLQGSSGGCRQGAQGSASHWGRYLLLEWHQHDLLLA